MLNIQKYYHNEYIVYEFIGSISNEADISNVKNMLNEDISKTYAFIFNFRSLTYLNNNAIKMLQDLYVTGVNNACEMLISNAHTQAAMMLEISQVDTLYTMKTTLKEATDLYYGDDYDLAYSN
jgi:anti-anti-sigma regulatory factor